MSKKDTHLTVRISTEELQEIKDFAATRNKSFTDFVLSAIRTQMDKEEGLDERLERLERAVFQKTA